MTAVAPGADSDVPGGALPRRPDGQFPGGAPLRRPDDDVPFAEPWQARVFAAAVLVCERLGLPWDAFRDALKAAVAHDPARPYYESVTAALRALVDAGEPGRLTRAGPADPGGAG